MNRKTQTSSELQATRERLLKTLSWPRLFLKRIKTWFQSPASIQKQLLAKTDRLFAASKTLNLDFIEDTPANPKFEILPGSLPAEILARFDYHQKVDQEELLKTLMEDFKEEDVLSAVSALLENGYLVSDLEGHLQSSSELQEQAPINRETSPFRF